MNKEEMKIGMYTEDEIFQYMTEQEGGMFGRSMYDAIFDKIHAQITEIEQLKDENQQLKEQLEKSEKARKEAIEELYVWGEALIPKFQQKMLNILDIDKGE